MSLTALGQKNHEENNYSNRTNEKNTEGLGEILCRCLKDPVQWHLGRQTLAHIFYRDREDYDAKTEEMCCYSLCLPTNSKQGFKLAYD